MMNQSYRDVQVLVVAFIGFLSFGQGAVSELVESFQGGVIDWKQGVPFGDVEGSRFERVLNGQKKDDAALKVTCSFKASGLNHLVVYKEVAMDLSSFGGISLMIRNPIGKELRLLAYIGDKKGGKGFYPLQFPEDSDRWIKFSVNFTDVSEGGSAASVDFSQVTNIGLMIQSRVPLINREFFVDEFQLLPKTTTGVLENAIITPNGDGILDAAKLIVRSKKGDKVDASIRTADGKVVRTLAKATPVGEEPLILEWNGMSDSGSLVDAGRYQVSLKVSELTKDFPVEVRKRKPWPKSSLPVNDFVPVAAFFEASPANSPYPTDPAGAKEYFDKCLAQMKEMGFNSVIPVWLPDHLWTQFLSSARSNDLKVMPLLSSLFGIIKSPQPIDEDEVERIILKKQKEIAGYEDVVPRFYLYDEPPVELMERVGQVNSILTSMDPTRKGITIVCGPDALRAAIKFDRPIEASFDMYPQVTGLETPSMGTFLTWVKGYRQIAGKLPLWITVQSFQSDEGWRMPLPVELSGSVYQSLAMGARGYVFFIYNAPVANNYRGLIDKDHKTTEIAGAASELAKKLRKILPLLAAFPADSFAWREEGSFLIGQYERPDGKKGFIVANTSVKDSKETLLPLEVKGDFVDLVSGTPLKIQEGKVSVNLKPGDAMVIIPKELAEKK